jgi:opacity protein-like surface antigen
LIFVASPFRHCSSQHLAVKAPPAPLAPVYNWTGTYVTGILDYSWGRSRNTFSETQAFVDPLIGSATSSQGYNNDVRGVSFGLGAGYRTQWNTAVVTGVDADFEYCGERGSGAATSISTNAVIQPYQVTTTTKCKWMGTATVTVGTPLSLTGSDSSPGQMLVYLKGGLAVADLAMTGTGQAVNQGTVTLNTPFALNGSNVKPGLAVGGGAEMMLSHSWNFGLEYLFTEFNSSTATGVVPAGCAGAVIAACAGTTGTFAGPASVSARFEDNIIRARLVYKFN